ncbi:hypothetical protein VOLCADRAFT_90596 [Volvox carteri f. nagariensis]|uniref:Uncharacterized protein n=1 Tax=Volvox carteri f. nagariensis TaxID=3068 RepID=D8TUU2_VOLCA|nr:uncharacterized protein VOLCADRAFT_90596 [Volvox carteri f. nagariensis]EFJ48881.1 hypothetical protein VOLCADRAFT_90596 [Volvox carteri f. nagariensis]|eukprot:XP_002950213.1 hypothetical protein VOLCADRAFT_90596 [Volvox carteri f. nagariensis]
MSHARNFRNTLPDYTPRASTAAGPEADFSTFASSVPRAALLGLFQETFEAVQGYRTSNPTIYTGSAGVALAMWHARRSLMRHCQACGGGDHAAAIAAATAAAAPVEPTAAGAVSLDAAALAALPSALLAAALDHVRTAVKSLTQGGPRNYSLSRGSRGGSMLDGGAGVHMTAALILHDAALSAGATDADALLRERDSHLRSFLDAYPSLPSLFVSRNDGQLLTATMAVTAMGTAAGNGQRERRVLVRQSRILAGGGNHMAPSCSGQY